MARNSRSRSRTMRKATRRASSRRSASPRTKRTARRSSAQTVRIVVDMQPRSVAAPQLGEGGELISARQVPMRKAQF